MVAAGKTFNFCELLIEYPNSRVFKNQQSFEFTKPEQWPTWRQRFSRYRIASKLDKESFDIQVNSLLYAMGSESEKIYSRFTVGGDTSFDDIMKKFDEHFTPQVNVIHERAVFHSRQQMPNENIESFVRALYELSEHAAFENKDDAIRDKLVVGLRDKELSEKLQMQKTLTVKDAIQQARHHELIKTQMAEQRHGTEINAVDARRGAGGRGRGHRGGNPGGGRGRGRGLSKSGTASSPSTCSRCGRTHTQQQNCPAKGKKCNKCNKMNHFAACCRSKGVNSIEEEEEEEVTEYFLGTVTDGSEPWTVVLDMQGQHLSFKIDTGADVSVMSTAEFQKLSPRPELQHSSTRLTSPGGTMKCQGQFTTEVTHKGQPYSLHVFVIDGKTDNLLSREASLKLGLVKKINSVDMPFGELDSQPVKCEPVKIVLKDDAKAYSLNVAGRVPIPFQGKVKAEL